MAAGGQRGRSKKLQTCLRYELKWGQDKGKLLKRWAAGHRTPAIDNWPELQPGLEFYFEAFYELSTDRPQVMEGTAPIPFSAICRFAAAYNISGDDFEDLRYFVRMLDNTLLRWHKENKPAKQDKNKITF